MMDEPVLTVDYSYLERDFTMHFYDLDVVPPSQAGRLIDFYKLWNSFRTSGKLPTRADLNFEALKGWHTNIRLVDLGEEVNSPKFNLILGETYKRYWGTDTMYNLYVANNPDNEEHRQKYFESIDCFMDYHYAFNAGIAPSADGSRAKITWIDLPMGSGNLEITHLITALIPV